MGNSVVNIELEQMQSVEEEMESEKDKLTVDPEACLPQSTNHASESFLFDPQSTNDLQPSPSLARQQLTVMLKRQWLLKKRGWGQTLAEIYSPMLMMLLLVMGWSQSDVDHYDAAAYANVTVPILEKLQPVLDDPDRFIEKCLTTAFIRESASMSPSDLAHLAEWIEKLKEGKVSDFKPTGQTNQGIPGGIGKDFFSEHNNSNLPEMMGFFKDCVDMGEVARLLLDTLLSYNGPIPVPSLDVFVSAHKILELALGSKIEEFPHTNFPGQDLSGSPYFNVSDTSGCRQLCESHPKCNAYTFSTTSKRWSGCWLKKRADSAYTSVNFNSGIVFRGKSHLPTDQMQRIQAAFGQALGNLLFLGKIAFAPNTTQVAALVDHLTENNLYFREYYQGTFTSEEEAIKAAMDQENMMWALVIVDAFDPKLGHVDYTIRMNYTTVPRTYRIFRKWFRGLNTHYRHYYTSGFLSLQDAINKYALQNLTNTSKAEVYGREPIWGVPFPTPNYTHNMFYDAVGPLMGLVMCLSTLYPLGMLVKGLVEEKETKSRETMLIMGLKPWIWSLSWLITYLVVFGLVSLNTTFLLTSTFLQHSSPSLVFLCFFLFTASLIPFGFFISVFFNKSKVAAFTAPFLHFAAIMPRYIFFRSSSGQAIPWKSTASLLPPTAFTFGLDLIGKYEGISEGLSWSNVAEDDFSMGRVLLLLVADFFIYAILAWYLEKVLPSEYGTNLPPWFIFQRSFWLGEFGAPPPPSSKYSRIASEESLGDVSVEESLEDEDLEIDGVEGSGSSSFPSQRIALKIRKLRKVFSGGKVAVSELTLNVYEGQITALLGHNGAGKSTTISMLTGLVVPTSGEAYVSGRNLKTEMAAIRRMIGVCPQQNVLFGRLTVLEHLELYGALKGIPPLGRREAAEVMVAQLGFFDKLHTPASDLSGGMKRKLQVAIAMIGGSRVVFLDEPTSGMDPHSRRAMWDLLRGFKEGRAIVLTTHYMDEADLLCDRIAILGEGKLRACGSSLFLKAKYGVGYNLTMVQQGDSRWEKEKIEAIIRRHVATSTTLSAAGGELVFRLPLTEKHHFSSLFKEIESEKEVLGIGAFGVSMTTLEEVFLRLASEGEFSSHPSGLVAGEAKLKGKQIENGTSSGKKLAVSVSRNGREEQSILVDKEGMVEVDMRSAQVSPVGVEGSRPPLEETTNIASRGNRDIHRSFSRAWVEMMRKRLIIARRDIKGLLNSTLLPVAVIAFVMLILKLEINPAGPSLSMNLSLLKPKPKFRNGHPLGPTSLMLPVAGIQGSQLSSMNSSYVDVVEIGNVSDSIGMSSYLLNSIPLLPPRYGALVFSDIVLQAYNFTNLKNLNLSSKISSLPLKSQENLNISRYFNLTSLNSSSSWDEIFSKLNRTNLLNSSTSPLDPSLLDKLGAAGIGVSSLNKTLVEGLLAGPEALALTKAQLAQKAAEIDKVLRNSSFFRNDSGMGLISPLTLLHNTSTDHSLPCLIQELAQTRFQILLKNGSGRLILRAHPLPLTQHEAKRFETIVSVLAALFVLIPFCYLAGTFSIFVVRERYVKSKHLQLVSGAGVLSYWTATFVFDFLQYCCIVAVTMVVFALYRDRAFIGSFTKACAASMLLSFFGMSVIPLSYLYSFAFSNHANAQVAIAGLHFVSGFLTVVASLVMDSLERTKELNHKLVQIYRLFPSFNLGEGLITLSELDLKADFTGHSINPYRWHIIGRPLTLMALEAVAYFLITLAIDLDVLSSLSAHIRVLFEGKVLPLIRRGFMKLEANDEAPDEDDDVAEERERVEKGSANDDAVVIKNLRKVYRRSGQSAPKVAVADLCLAIPPQQCFGFLGVNGAGKTTTMAMLTGDLKPTAGDAFVNGSSILLNLPAVQQQIGYCPQFDPLLDLMTGREHLRMFARLKGVPEQLVESVVKDIIISVGLTRHADNCAGTYSGGNKRKLSLGIALVGNPAAVFLDEPSSGMDPLARRTMWGIISRAALSRGASVILTTHSMEECEALCSRVGLMQRGRLVCLGSIQHLKHRFGEGYYLEINAGKDQEDLFKQVDSFVLTTFHGAVIEEKHLGRVRYRIPMKGLSLSHVFGEIERQTQQLGIEDYSVSQSSLEQVFLAFAKSETQQT